MPRDIKFRAWHKLANGMVAIQRINFKNGKVLPYGWNIPGDGEIFELMQFTGIHDKNGKEIYEGDIVHLIERHYEDCSREELISTDESIELVVFRMHTFGVGDKDRQTIRPFLWIVTGDYEIEVIGNIFENPELLKEGGQGDSSRENETI